MLLHSESERSRDAAVTGWNKKLKCIKVTQVTYRETKKLCNYTKGRGNAAENELNPHYRRRKVNKV